ncbi:hypothetical protein MLD38_032452 [Melastoma candidum]|uniref:Uncharacterized protein n=1 Tax=Melastoma candidum TaxID=119954 RepID=A0ACB9M7Y2_9MYRT|nr:hypothetical protein MLD38_032452 [Melastoma candidum]
MRMGRLWHVVLGLKEPLMMVIVQVGLGGVSIMYKLALREGMSPRVMVAYRLIFATAFLAPIAFFCERKIRPRLTLKVLIQAFFCGLFGGSLGQTLNLESLGLTSAMYASAMLNLIPGVTFVLAVLFRLEKLSIRTAEGIAKVMGTLLGLGGAMLLTFYKGFEIKIFSRHVDLLKVDLPSVAGAPPVPQQQNMVLGSVLAIGACISVSSWLILQAKMSKDYPCQLSSTTLMSFMGAIQSLVYSLAREHEWIKWRLRWNTGLLAVVYAGVFGSGLSITLMTWCVRTRGPLFVSMFNPLVLVAVAFMAPMLLDEKLYLGSILGSALIICGLYLVLWGQGRERKRLNQLVPTESIVEVVATTQTKDNGDDRGSKCMTSREEAAQEDSELEDGRRSGVKKIIQEGEIIMLPMAQV